MVSSFQYGLYCFVGGYMCDSADYDLRRFSRIAAPAQKAGRCGRAEKTMNNER
jgi:hypothetical protein